jgi:hypothetical protein
VSVLLDIFAAVRGPIISPLTIKAKRPNISHFSLLIRYLYLKSPGSQVESGGIYVTSRTTAN